MVAADAGVEHKTAVESLGAIAQMTRVVFKAAAIERLVALGLGLSALLLEYLLDEGFVLRGGLKLGLLGFQLLEFFFQTR